MPVAGMRRLAIDEIVLDGRALDLVVTGRTTKVGIKRTFTGASTVTVTVEDQDGLVQTSGILDRAVDLHVPGDDGTPLWFRLAGDASDQDGVLTMTFESRVWSRLAEHDEPRSMLRSKVTAAQFLLALVREVRVERIPFVSRELDDVQRVAEAETPDATTDPAKRDRSRAKGLADQAKITVKGKTATPQQRRVIDGCLREADKLGASPFVMACVVACITQESDAGGLLNVQTGNDDVGIYQQGRNWVSVADAKDPAASTRAFLTSRPPKAPGFRALNGSIRLTGGDLEALVKKVQVSVGGYGQWADEAHATVRAFGAAGGVASDGDKEVSVEAYKFERGQDGKRETTTACGLRIAQERNWRFFESGGAIYYDSDEALLRSRPLMTVTPTSPGLVSRPTHTRDVGAPTQTSDLRWLADGWGAPPGSVAVLDGWGTAKDGRWLVSDVAKDDVTDVVVAVTLARGQAAKLEPAPSTSVVATSGSVGAPAGLRANSSVRQRIVKVAIDSQTSKTNFLRYSQNGATTDDPTPPAPNRTDCSQWARACYLRGGGPDPGSVTGAMMQKGRATTAPRPGDLLVGPDHVEMYVGDGKTIGHGSEPIDGSTTKYWLDRGLRFRTYLDD